MIEKAKRRAEPVAASLIVSEAEPVAGVEAYKRYLDSSKTIPPMAQEVHGQVTVSFLVNAQGRPETFKIEKSLSRELDNEAVRLIKEGPAWRAIKSSPAKASVTINF